MAKRSTSTRAGGKVKITGASKGLTKAARASTREGASGTKTDATGPLVDVEVQHTRLAKPGESPDTQMEPTTEKREVVTKEADDGQRTRLATPADPEARKIHEETQEMNKVTGRAPVEKVQNAKDLPNEGDSPRAKRDKQQAVFDKADEAGKADIIEANRLRGAALGF